MNFKKKILLILLILLPIISFSQNWEYGFYFGASNYEGDMAPNVNFKETHISYGIVLKKYLSPFFVWNFSAKKGKISGDDNNFKDLAQRNLNFETEIIELSTVMEFSYYPFAVGYNPKKVTPFVYTGIAFFMFDPKTKYNNEFIRLKPLKTEGQGLENGPKEYSLYQLSIPIGGGIKASITKNIKISFDLGYRAVFSDYLDDVSGNYYDKRILSEKVGNLAVELSDRTKNKIGYTGKQRGVPEYKDWYIFSGFTITYKIGNSKCYEFNRKHKGKLITY